jgi:hypothetical protein
MAAMELSEGETEEGEEAQEPVAESGDLFSDALDTEGSTGEVSSQENSETGGVAPVLSEAPQEIAPAVTETSTPTAEPSEEAAEAQALVERQNAEEVEVEP